jgi:hypothetical protein
LSGSAAGIAQSHLVFCHHYSFSFYPFPEALEGNTNAEATLHSPSNESKKNRYQAKTTIDFPILHLLKLSCV